MVWKQPLSSSRKKFITMSSLKKVVATVIWDHQGVLLFDIITRKTTVNTTNYCVTWLRKVAPRKRARLVSKGDLLLHDNVRPDKYSGTRKFVLRFRWKVFKNPPYRPDLASSDVYLFELLKKHLEGRHFRTDDKVHTVFLMWLHNIDTDFFKPLSIRWCTDGAYSFIIMVILWRSNMYQCRSMLCISLNSWM